MKEVAVADVEEVAADVLLHIENTTFYHLEWPRLTRQETTSFGENVQKGNPLTLLVGMQVGAATLEKSVEIPQKIKNRAIL